MIVVFDTSPLLYLCLIDLLKLLPELYGQIVIPEAVEAEIVAPGAPAAFRAWVSSHLAGFLSALHP